MGFTFQRRDREEKRQRSKPPLSAAMVNAFVERGEHCALNGTNLNGMVANVNGMAAIGVRVDGQLILKICPDDCLFSARQYERALGDRAADRSANGSLVQVLAN